VHPADRLEQAQVRAAQPLIFGDLDEYRGSRILDLVHGVADAGNELPGIPRRADRAQRELVELGVGGWHRVSGGQHGVQELPAVLGDAEVPGPAAEQARGQRALDGVRRGQVGQPGGDRGGGEPVVGQGHEHRLEDPDLRLRRAPLGHHPHRQLAEPDLAHQILG